MNDDLPVCTLVNQDCEWNETQISIIEQKYNAKYVLDTCIKGMGGGWIDFPIAIFYTTSKTHPQGSNYFGFFRNPSLNGSISICNGLSGVKNPIDALMIDDHVLYSEYSHHFHSFHGVHIDGGRDYTLIGGPRINEAEEVKLRIIGPNIHVERKEWQKKKSLTQHMKKWFRKVGLLN